MKECHSFYSSSPRLILFPTPYCLLPIPFNFNNIGTSFRKRFAFSPSILKIQNSDDTIMMYIFVHKQAYIIHM